MTESESLTLPELVRQAYLDRSTGLVEVQADGGQERLFFRDGELYLSPTHAAARTLGAALDDVGDGRSAASPEIQQGITTLVRKLSRDRKALATFSQQSPPANAVGPLPAILLAMELAVYDCREQDLIARLGGERQRFQAASDSPAQRQLGSLEPEMAQVLTSLVQPAPLGELLRGAGGERMAFLRGLTRLWAVGLVEEVGGRSTKVGGDEDLLPPRLLEHFYKRVEEGLESDPLTLDANDHRQQIADLISQMGKQNHYQMLGVGTRAGEDEVLRSFNRLARIVHPSHAERLGLGGREEVIRVLFEHATEAYLVLSDPRRRASYNTIVGIQMTTEVESVQREEEKRQMARQNYRRALSCLSSMDYSLAIDLLKEASRLDPRPEYFAKLGQVQVKNPNWHSQSLASYRRAVELAPEDVGIRVGFGESLEAMGMEQEAVEQYGAALELMPSHPVAVEAMERLGGNKGFWRS